MRSNSIKKVIISIILVIGILLIGINISNVKADSGWDFDYDSKSGSESKRDSVSSSGSSSSNDFYYKRNNNGKSRWDEYTPEQQRKIKYISISVVSLFVIGDVCLLIYALRKQNGNGPKVKKVVNTSSEPIKEDLSKIERYGIKEKDFINYASEKYKEIQIAWMNFDYDKLNELLTNELFNTYSMNLSTLSTKEQKNIMENINVLDCYINSIMSIGGIITIKVYLKVKQKDYVVDKNNKVVRGNKKELYEVDYLLTFVRKEKTEEDIICPNCGNHLEMNVSKKCPYCHSIIVVDPQEFVMSKKTILNQKVVKK